MSASVAAGNLLWICEGAEHCYGLRRTELLAAAGLAADDLADPAAFVPARALEQLLRFVLVQSHDPGFGLRLAELGDLRTQGFWGYALLSSSTLHERIGVHVRYQQLRAPVEISFRVEGEHALLEFSWVDLAPDIASILTDWGIGRSCRDLAQRAQGADLDLHVWLSYPERPHHRPLRAMLGPRIVFDAPFNRLQLPKSELYRERSEGDPHLHVLAARQLDQRLERERERGQESLLERVRRSVLSHLERDISLVRVARDLGTSARTLQRQLGALSISFQELLDGIRHERAIRYLADTDEAVERVALRLGYGDASNFRRAFRRWTGATPAEFRAQRKLSAAARADAAQRLR